MSKHHWRLLQWIRVSTCLPSIFWARCRKLLPETNISLCFVNISRNGPRQYLTKWPLADIKADTIARIFVEKIICRHGAPTKLLSDQGANFLAKVMEVTCRLCNTLKLKTTAYHPQCDGLVERFNKTITTMLSMFVSSNQRDLDVFILYVLFAYRTAKNSTTGYDSFYLLYGTPAQLPLDIVFNSAINANYNKTDDYVNDMQIKFTAAWKITRENIERSQISQKRSYDQTARAPEFSAGQTVLLQNPSVGIRKTKKFTPVWHGPFVIKEIKLPNAYIQDVRKSSGPVQKVHVNRLKLYSYGNQNQNRVQGRKFVLLWKSKSKPGSRQKICIPMEIKIKTGFKAENRQ